MTQPVIPLHQCSAFGPRASDFSQRLARPVRHVPAAGAVVQPGSFAAASEWERKVTLPAAAPLHHNVQRLDEHSPQAPPTPPGHLLGCRVAGARAFP